MFAASVAWDDSPVQPSAWQSEDTARVLSISFWIVKSHMKGETAFTGLLVSPHLSEIPVIPAAFCAGGKAVVGLSNC